MYLYVFEIEDVVLGKKLCIDGVENLNMFDRDY